MSRGDRPTFTVVVGTATTADRRLISVATVRALTGLTEGDVSDETLTLLIDAALATAARYCKLATAGAQPPTFAQEQVRATWPDTTVFDFYWHRTWLPAGRGHELILPWRTPITAVTVTEGETELVQDVDFRLLGAGVIERLSGGVFCGWALGGIVVDYTAGWAATPADPSAEPESEPMPADLVALISDQVRLSVIQRTADPTLRSEDIPGIWSGSYNVAGGDAISAYGLGRPLQMALDAYRAPPSFA